MGMILSAHELTDAVQVELTSGHRMYVAESLAPTCRHYVVDCVTTTGGENVALAFDAYVVDLGRDGHPDVQFVQLFPAADFESLPSMRFDRKYLEGIGHEGAITCALEAYFEENAGVVAALRSKPIAPENQSSSGRIAH